MVRFSVMKILFSHFQAVLENNIKHLQALGFLQQQSQAAAGISTGLPQLPALPSLTLQQQQQQQQVIKVRTLYANLIIAKHKMSEKRNEQFFKERENK